MLGKEISPLKAPGLECFTSKFLKLVRNEIPNLYEQFLRT